MTLPFIKVIPPGGWSFNEGPSLQLVKVSSRGLRGNDLQTFIKRAGYQFADQIRKLDLKPGDVPTHDVVVGATEFFGANRNGDSFMEKACRDFHDTFVKYARLYRNHKNTNPKESYGYVKLSTFNEAMKRIELLSIYNGTKEAADRNGGLVADEEIELLNKDRDFPVSMACKVALDKCSSCGNEAKNRTQYCKGIDEGGSCPGGGLMNKIGSVIDDDDNPILCAHNPEPYFFDKSKVVRGADRIAFSMGLNKAADGHIKGGAALAEALGVRASAELNLTGVPEELFKLAWRLAAIESNPQESGRARLAFIPSVQPEVDWTAYGTKIGEALQAMADEQVVMPVEGFLTMMGQTGIDLPKVASCVREHLPGVYNRLIRSGEIVPLLANNPFVPASTVVPRTTKRWAEKVAKDYSLNPAKVEKRALLGAIRNNGLFPTTRSESMVKTASACHRAVEEVANHYAIYKLSAALAMPAARREEVLRLLVLQNTL